MGISKINTKGCCMALLTQHVRLCLLLADIRVFSPSSFTMAAVEAQEIVAKEFC